MAFYFSIDRHLGCFHLETVIFNYKHSYVYPFGAQMFAFLLRVVLGVKLLVGVCMFLFSRYYQFPKVVVPIFTPASYV